MEVNGQLEITKLIMRYLNLLEAKLGNKSISLSLKTLRLLCKADNSLSKTINCNATEVYMRNQ